MLVKSAAPNLNIHIEKFEHWLELESEAGLSDHLRLRFVGQGMVRVSDLFSFSARIEKSFAQAADSLEDFRFSFGVEGVAGDFAMTENFKGRVRVALAKEVIEAECGIFEKGLDHNRILQQKLAGIQPDGGEKPLRIVPLRKAG